MNEEKWQVIKAKFETVLEWYEYDKKTGQLTVDSLCTLFPTELKAIIDYIDELEQENHQLKDRIEKVMKYLNDNRDTCYMDEDINYLLKILKGE